MEIKGTAIKTISDFVKERYAGEYANWIKALPPESLSIVNSVRSSNWYPLKEGGIIPSETVGKLFFDNDPEKGAWELGRYSASVALKGVYKLYVKFSSPGHIISRAGRIITAYYTPSTLEVGERTSNSVQLLITEFSPASPIIEARIGGWIESALEVSGCTGIKVNIPKSLTKGDKATVIECQWE
jgi:predicted RNA-binding protein YlqC (UPF0109 family)